MPHPLLWGDLTIRTTLGWIQNETDDKSFAETEIGRDHPREIKTMDDMRRLLLYVDDFISKIH